MHLEGKDYRRQSLLQSIHPCRPFLPFTFLPFTKIGLPAISKRQLLKLLSRDAAKMAGLSIMNPLRWRTGRIASSQIGLRNLVLCHEVAKGPASDSPSPTIVTVIRFGLSNMGDRKFIDDS